MVKKYPKLLWNEKKLRANVRFLNNLFNSYENPIKWIPVTKGICAYPDIIRVLIDEGVSEIADSRIENIKVIKEVAASCKTLLLRLPSIYEVPEVIEHADISLVSETETLLKLQESAKAVGVKHSIILMIELGDLREGILPDDVLAMGRFILQQDHLQWLGIGTNLACYSGVLPTREKMERLVEMKRNIANELEHDLMVVSGGNSSTLSLMLEHDLPKGINQLRLGESLLLGNDTASGRPILGMHSDVFKLEAEVIEVKVKSSMPQGKQGKNAFGHSVVLEDLGQHSRAIVAIGRQDVVIEDIEPIDERIRILGGSSDHMILDVQEVDIKVGDIVAFSIRYSSLLQAMTSPYIRKEKLIT